MGHDPLTQDQLGVDIRDPTPLWLYILRESEVGSESQGHFLGPVGGRIIGEVLLGLLELDPQSWFSRDLSWTPMASFPDIDVDGDGRVTMADVVTLV